MVTIKDISYDTDFIWKGERYTQVIRPKNPVVPKFLIICRLARGQSNWVTMPLGRKVKPFVKLKVIEEVK